MSHISLIISVLALAISGVTLVLNLTAFWNTTEPPRLFSRINEIEAVLSSQPDPSAKLRTDFTLAITNTRSVPIQVVGCMVEGRGFVSPHGIDLKEFPCLRVGEESVFRGFEIAANSTVHHEMRFHEVWNARSLESIINRRELSPGLLREFDTQNKRCVLKSARGLTGVYGWDQSCDFMGKDYANSANFAEIVVVIGDGTRYRVSLIVGYSDWPWVGI